MLNAYVSEKLTAQRIDAAGRYWEARARAEGDPCPDRRRSRGWWRWTPGRSGCREGRLDPTRKRTVTVLP